MFSSSYYIGEGHGDVILTLIKGIWSDAYIAYHLGLPLILWKIMRI